MNTNLNQHEKLSALADGQLPADQWASTLDFAAEDEGHEAWQLYHLVGDVLRSPELAPRADGGDFMARLRQQLAQEPPPVWAAQAIKTTTIAPSIAPPQPVFTAASVPIQAANDPVFRWKMVAGLASLAAVVMVVWSISSALYDRSAGAQMASVPAMVPTVAMVVNPSSTLAAADGQAPQIMIRDPRLDELLAAHKQFGGASALQLPAGFLRNATFELPSR